MRVCVRVIQFEKQRHSFLLNALLANYTHHRRTSPRRIRSCCTLGGGGRLSKEGRGHNANVKACLTQGDTFAQVCAHPNVCSMHAKSLNTQPTFRSLPSSYPSQHKRHTTTVTTQPQRGYFAPSFEGLFPKKKKMSHMRKKISTPVLQQRLGKVRWVERTWVGARRAERQARGKARKHI